LAKKLNLYFKLDTKLKAGKYLIVKLPSDITFAPDITKSKVFTIGVSFDEKDATSTIYSTCTVSGKTYTHTFFSDSLKTKAVDLSANVNYIL
jgi:hypothetical protein